jgi:hypothetical protein
LTSVIMGNCRLIGVHDRSCIEIACGDMGCLCPLATLLAPDDAERFWNRLIGYMQSSQKGES